MDYFRLTYAVSTPDNTDFWKTSRRFEVIGSQQAIFDLWFHLTQLQRLSIEGQHESACPHFLEVRNKDGILQDLTKGLYAGLVNCNTFT